MQLTNEKSGKVVIDIAYGRRISAAGKRDGHGCIYVDARND